MLGQPGGENIPLAGDAPRAPGQSATSGKRSAKIGRGLSIGSIPRPVRGMRDRNGGIPSHLEDSLGGRVPEGKKACARGLPT